MIPGYTADVLGRHQNGKPERAVEEDNQDWEIWEGSRYNFTEVHEVGPGPTSRLLK